MAGLRDRALILIGFVAALRRSELVGLDVTDLADHPNGMVIELARSKPNRAWLDAAKIVDGPLFRPFSKGNRALDRRLTAGVVNTVVQTAAVRAIAHQTRHRSLHTVGSYIRVDTAWEDNAATALGL